VRLMYLIVTVLFVAAAIAFVVQNRATMTISFLEFSVSAPVAILSAIMYFARRCDGRQPVALLRRSVPKL
jgi:uncharacterized integral membrane protein